LVVPFPTINVSPLISPPPSPTPILQPSPPKKRPSPFLHVKKKKKPTGSVVRKLFVSSEPRVSTQQKKKGSHHLETKKKPKSPITKKKLGPSSTTKKLVLTPVREPGK